jgi:uncharacterized lipoprotein YddW (UPF0748 family)
MHILPLFLFVLLGGERVLDDFRYADTPLAQAAWVAAEGTMPVEVAADAGRPVMQLQAPFATQPTLRRAVVDRRASFDLTAPSGFLLEVSIDDPRAIGSLTLYFRSGGGWFAAHKPIVKKGWQTLRFSKAAFTAEGSPTGWDKIDGIRLAAWRPPGKEAGDTAVRVRRLAAVWHDVAVLTSARHESRSKPESKAARKASQKLTAMLDELGLGSDLIDEDAIVEGALGPRRIVVLPRGLTPSDRCAKALARFVKSGGKLMPYPALPADDRAAKKQLSEAIGSLVPAFWQQMAQAELDRAGRVGHYQQFSEILDGVKADTPVIAGLLARGKDNWSRANDLFAQGAYAKVMEPAQAAHDSLVKAYLLAAKSPEHEGRAVWNHSGTGAYPGDWDRSAKLLADNGFNMVLPNMLWGGSAHYASDVLPRSPIFQKYGDQIEQCCAAAKRHGIDVHVWKVNFNLATAPKDFVAKLRREGRTQVSVKGEPYDWLCPSNPENRKLELESLLEVARKYPIDGLHLDYIRYPEREYCYCDSCRRRFEAESGRPVSDRDWPKACYSGPRREEYNDWRCRQITSLVAAISREAKKIRPGLKISAAVFVSYPWCRESLAQDWPAWVRSGYLDFVCPMDYMASDAEFVSLARNDMKLVGGRVPTYVGIGASATVPPLTPDRVVGQILLARSLGAAGFVIFNFDPATAATIVPAVGLGVGARRAVPPHKEK